MKNNEKLDGSILTKDMRDWIKHMLVKSFENGYIAGHESGFAAGKSMIDAVDETRAGLDKIKYGDEN